MEAREAQLVPDRTVPSDWIKERVDDPAIVLRDLDRLRQEASKANAPREKRDQVRDRIYLARTFVAHLRGTSRALHRLDGGNPNLRGFVILNEGVPYRWLLVPPSTGTN